MTDNERFTKDCILQKIEPVLLNAQKIPENTHTMEMVGLSGVKYAFAIFEEDDKEKRLKLITDACMEKYEITDDDLVTCIHLRQHMYRFDTLANALGICSSSEMYVFNSSISSRERTASTASALSSPSLFSTKIVN